jgi:soluble lytic murein transglycosylase-like protein
MRVLCLFLALAVLMTAQTQIVYSRSTMKASSTAELIMFLQPNLDPEIAAIHAKYIDKFASKWKVDRLKVISITHQESKFRADAQSSVGCIGAMQVNPNAHQDKLARRGITWRDLYFLRNNYDIGSEILHDCLKSSRTFDEALNKYSGGSRKYTKEVKKIYGILHRCGLMTT